MTKREDIVCLV